MKPCFVCFSYTAFFAFFLFLISVGRSIRFKKQPYAYGAQPPHRQHIAISARYTRLISVLKTGSPRLNLLLFFSFLYAEKCAFIWKRRKLFSSEKHSNQQILSSVLESNSKSSEKPQTSVHLARNEHEVISWNTWLAGYLTILLSLSTACWPLLVVLYTLGGFVYTKSSNEQFFFSAYFLI